MADKPIRREKRTELIYLKVTVEIEHTSDVAREEAIQLAVRMTSDGSGRGCGNSAGNHFARLKASELLTDEKPEGGS